jgi:hypothetical protein
MRSLFRLLRLLPLLVAWVLPAQTRQLAVTPDSLVLYPGDTARLVPTVRAGGGAVVANAAITWSSLDTALVTVRAGKVTAKQQLGCTVIRPQHSTYVRTQIAACVVARPVASPVPAPSTGGAPLFTSDWSAALGNTRAALMDGGTWDRMIECGGGVFDVMAVVAGAPLGWSLTPNVLRVTQLGPTKCGNLERTQQTIAAGQSHWGRLYFRNDETGTGHWHPVTYNCCGAIQMVPWLRFADAGGVRIGVGTSRDGQGATLNYPYNVWIPGARAGAGPVRLPHGQWFRYEWELRYVTPTSYRIYPRLYDLAGTLLYDYRSFFQNDNQGAGAKSLATWYEVDGRAFGITDPQLATHFGLGNEGPGGSSATGGSWYLARVGLGVTGWLGR